jgi:N-acetylglutamate synthase-like GNAT family acetyltransferase
VDELVIRTATAGDAPALHALIAAYQTEGHLLPRTLDEVRRQAPLFVVCETGGTLKACAELARLSPRLAEIRSLVVARDVRRAGVAARLIGELRARAAAAGFASICAFTHDARFFVRHSFSIVPHVWLPEKIARDCQGCPGFRQCGQFAMIQTLPDAARRQAPVVPQRQVAVA